MPARDHDIEVIVLFVSEIYTLANFAIEACSQYKTSIEAYNHICNTLAIHIAY